MKWVIPLHVGPKGIGVEKQHEFAVRDHEQVIYGLFFTRGAAQLFAAAPDLLAACELALEKFREIYASRSGAMPEAMQAVEQAIAKAEGKEAGR